MKTVTLSIPDNKLPDVLRIAMDMGLEIVSLDSGQDGPNGHDKRSSRKPGDKHAADFLLDYLADHRDGVSGPDLTRILVAKGYALGTARSTVSTLKKDGWIENGPGGLKLAKGY